MFRTLALLLFTTTALALDPVEVKTAPRVEPEAMPTAEALMAAMDLSLIHI